MNLNCINNTVHCLVVLCKVDGDDDDGRRARVVHETEDRAFLFLLRVMRVVVSMFGRSRRCVVLRPIKAGSRGDKMKMDEKMTFEGKGVCRS